MILDDSHNRGVHDAKNEYVGMLDMEGREWGPALFVLASFPHHITPRDRNRNRDGDKTARCHDSSEMTSHTRNQFTLGYCTGRLDWA